MAGGKYSGTPIAKAWVNKKAWEIGLEGQELANALGYAGNEGWLADGSREGQILLTSKGEATMLDLVPASSVTIGFCSGPETRLMRPPIGRQAAHQRPGSTDRLNIAKLPELLGKGSR